MLHDLNVLGTAAQLELPLTVVVVNNDGGGIFSFLPHADPAVLAPEIFTEYLATPHGIEFAPVRDAAVRFADHPKPAAEPAGKAGIGSAVNDTTREVGGALGIAVLATREHA